MAGKNQLLLHDWKALKQLWLSQCSQEQDLFWDLLWDRVEPLGRKVKWHICAKNVAWLFCSFCLWAKSPKYQLLQGQLVTGAAELTAKHFLRVCVVRLNFCGNCPVSGRSWSHSMVLSVGVFMGSLPSLWLFSTSTELTGSLMMLRPLSLY